MSRSDGVGEDGDGRSPPAPRGTRLVSRISRCTGGEGRGGWDWRKRNSLTKGVFFCITQNELGDIMLRSNNGMIFSRRNLQFANTALVVTDVPDDEVLEP